MAETKKWEDLSHDERKEIIRKGIRLPLDLESSEAPPCYCGLETLSQYHGMFPPDIVTEENTLEEGIKELLSKRTLIEIPCLRVCPCMDHKESVTITCNEDGTHKIEPNDIPVSKWLLDNRDLNLPNF